MENVFNLSEVKAILNEAELESVKIANPTQMWRAVDMMWEKWLKPNDSGQNGAGSLEAEIEVLAGDKKFKVFKVSRWKDGKWVKVNKLKENNRGHLAAEMKKFKMTVVKSS